MSSREIHFKFYKMLRQDVVNLESIDEIKVNDALDIKPQKYGQEINYIKFKYGLNEIKKATHRHFDYFLKRYHELAKTPLNERKDIIRTLKYYWVNHLIIDAIYNETKKVFQSLNDTYKIINRLSDPYQAYGLKLLKYIGVNSNSIQTERTLKFIDMFSGSSGVYRERYLAIKDKHQFDLKKCKLPVNLRHELSRSHAVQKVRWNR